MPTQTKDAAAHISTQLDGQIALITGASSGLGTRFAKVLAAAGAQVIIAARRKQKLEALAAEIGEGAHIYELDVTDIGNIPAFYDQLEQDNILPTILVNNAGLNIPKTALEVEPQDYATIMETNLTAPFFMATEFARRHIPLQTKARIINIGSVGAFEVLPSVTPYCISKAGIVMMTRGLAREWAKHDINVNAICPGYIETAINDFWWETEGGKRQINRFPRKRLGDASDLDGTLLLLAGAGGVGITGTAIQVADGQYI